MIQNVKMEKGIKKRQPDTTNIRPSNKNKVVCTPLYKNIEVFFYTLI